MFDVPPWLWIVFTVLAAAGQTVRNAMQRELTASLGTVGATHVRFLFGFPFALIFLLVAMIVLDHRLPAPPIVFWPWVIGGALAQMAATALMLATLAVTLALPVSKEVKLAMIVLQGGVSGALMPAAIALLWEVVGRGSDEP